MYFISWHVTCDMWHVTRDLWHVTRDMWHLTCDIFVWVNILSKFQLQALTVYDLWYYEDLEEKDEWINQSMNQSMNDEAVYRTAPATPGLLNIAMCSQQIRSRGFWHSNSVTASSHVVLFFHSREEIEIERYFTDSYLKSKIIQYFMTNFRKSSYLGTFEFNRSWDFYYDRITNI